jgi:hypothetical protein
MVERIYIKLNTVPEQRVDSILYRSRTVFQISRTVMGLPGNYISVNSYDHCIYDSYTNV